LQIDFYLEMELIDARIDSLLKEVRESDNIELDVTEHFPLKQELELTYQSTSTENANITERHVGSKLLSTSQ
jgi:putative salt-induced outer membrane protein YdiY